MPSSGFVPTIPASEQPQTRVVDRAATGRAGVLEIQHKLLRLLLYLYEMGEACSAYGGGERCVQGFGGET